jgi:hypothetical protein
MLFLPPSIILPISLLSPSTDQDADSFLHKPRFIVSDPNYNYVSARFPPDAELMAQRLLEILGVSKG